jgi:hypothetical protein
VHILCKAAKLFSVVGPMPFGFFDLAKLRNRYAIASGANRHFEDFAKGSNLSIFGG